MMASMVLEYMMFVLMSKDWVGDLLMGKYCGVCYRLYTFRQHSIFKDILCLLIMIHPGTRGQRKDFLMTLVGRLSPV